MLSADAAGAIAGAADVELGATAGTEKYHAPSPTPINALPTNVARERDLDVDGVE
jgi:hypothetical protein